MILEGPGKVLEALKPCFSFVFRINEHALPSCSQYNKTAIFARFYRLQSPAHTAKNRVLGVALKAFLDMVPEWLPKIPAGIHFLVFASTLQRGGTCEAHPPPPEGMPGVPDIKHWILLCCLPLRPAFRIRLQIPSSKAFPHPYIPSPGPARTAKN